MFTGIIEATATVEEIHSRGGNKTFVLSSPIAGELKVDQSLSHNGVCLTVERVDPAQSRYQVTAIAETLEKSMLGRLKEKDEVNLERSMGVQGRMDGHFVLGHVDCTGTVQEIQEKDGSWEFILSYPAEFESLVVYKGSVSLNGISLTIAESLPARHSLRVAIIPFTFEHTNIKNWRVGDSVNMEFDVLGKYVKKIMDNMQIK